MHWRDKIHSLPVDLDHAMLLVRVILAPLQEFMQTCVQLLKLKTVTSLEGEAVVLSDNIKLLRVKLFHHIDNFYLGIMWNMSDLMWKYCEIILQLKYWLIYFCCTPDYSLKPLVEHSIAATHQEILHLIMCRGEGDQGSYGYLKVLILSHGAKWNLLLISHNWE